MCYEGRNAGNGLSFQVSLFLSTQALLRIYCGVNSSNFFTLIMSPPPPIHIYIFPSRVLSSVRNRSGIAALGRRGGCNIMTDWLCGRLRDWVEDISEVPLCPTANAFLCQDADCDQEPAFVSSAPHFIPPVLTADIHVESSHILCNANIRQNWTKEKGDPIIRSFNPFGLIWHWDYWNKL